MVHVPVEIDREIDPDGVVDGYLSESFDHDEFAREAAICSDGMAEIQECIKKLASAALAIRATVPGVSASICPFVGVKRDIEV